MNWYYVQGSYSDGRICFESDCDDEAQAIAQAKKLFIAPWFEGDSVRVLTIDGELVHESSR